MRLGEYFSGKRFGVPVLSFFLGNCSMKHCVIGRGAGSPL